ncbi:Hsp20/alpha crystallin family protein [Rubrivivax gelatinosus]|uniref:Hsp20/alpha crystallin family protein n=1 Tax=Rubrivivax gelatinosus TaxID=28068 RepID=UPI0002DF4574|nr:Hsp20/alpha crystallin family protein [Rubrivivax gelatinosus]MBG6082068.1 HSP20 family protein [Rubrivivax gelatinosus]
MYRTLFPRDVFAELDRLQRDLTSVFEGSPSIRGIGRGGYPALNVGSTDSAFEVYAFAPGLDPATIDVNLDRGVLTIDGERKAGLQAQAEAGSDSKRTVHLQERFTGRFRRVVSLPDDIDPNAVTADYKDGVLRVSVQRRAAAQPRRIAVN